MANPIVEFNDSQLGVVLGSVFHTLGAIAFLGGLVGYLSWHRHLVKGQHNRKVLDTAAFLTYLAIVVNLLGGFMRTFETGHPRLEQFAESPWVRAISIKHVFLFAAQGAAIYLFEVMAPRLVKAHKAAVQPTELSPAGHRIGVVVVALGILVAAVLGAVTQVVPLVSASGHVDEMPVAGPTVYHNFTGQLTSTPAMPAVATGSFDVENTTQLLHAVVTWNPGQADLQVRLSHGSQSFTVTGSAGSGEGRLESPEPGTWTYEVSSSLAIGTTWSLSVAAAPTAAEHQHDA